MQTPRTAVGLAPSIIALHQQIWPPCNFADVRHGSIQTDRLGQRETEALIVNAILDASDCWLEDMGTRRAVQWQCDSTVNDEYRQLVLRAGKAETDTFLAGKERSLRELVDDVGQLLVM